MVRRPSPLALWLYILRISCTMNPHRCFLSLLSARTPISRRYWPSAFGRRSHALDNDAMRYSLRRDEQSIKLRSRHCESAKHRTRSPLSPTRTCKRKPEDRASELSAPILDVSFGMSVRKSHDPDGRDA